VVLTVVVVVVDVVLLTVVVVVVVVVGDVVFVVVPDVPLPTVYNAECSAHVQYAFHGFETAIFIDNEGCIAVKLTHITH